MNVIHIHMCVHAKLLQSCPTVCDPMDYSLPGSLSVHGIFQARILEWLPIAYSRGFSQPRDQTLSPALADGFFTVRTTREAHIYYIHFLNIFLDSILI